MPAAAGHVRGAHIDGQLLDLACVITVQIHPDKSVGLRIREQRHALHELHITCTLSRALQGAACHWQWPTGGCIAAHKRPAAHTCGGQKIVRNGCSRRYVAHHGLLAHSDFLLAAQRAALAELRFNCVHEALHLAALRHRQLALLDGLGAAHH